MYLIDGVGRILGLFRLILAPLFTLSRTILRSRHRLLLGARGLIRPIRVPVLVAGATRVRLVVRVAARRDVVVGRIPSTLV